MKSKEPATMIRKGPDLMQELLRGLLLGKVQVW